MLYLSLACVKCCCFLLPDYANFSGETFCSSALNISSAAFKTLYQMFISNEHTAQAIHHLKHIVIVAQ